MEQVARGANTGPHWLWALRDGFPDMKTRWIPVAAPLVLVTVTVWLGLSPIV